VLIYFTSSEKNYPFRLKRERAILYETGYPLIFQNIHLPELAPFLDERLLRLRRAGPSASLDKSADQGYLVVAG
jgi:hypothetical protein